MARKQARFHQPAIYNAVAPTLSDGDDSALNVDSSGNLLISGTIGGSTPATLYNGKKVVTTAGTRVTLATSTTVKSVVIKALIANTGVIYVGDATVASTNGFALSAGDTLGLDIANLATVNLDSSVNGEGVTYIASV